ncbi:MAG: hypothetical protein AAF438_05215 [Pseudomonadota bacterium]
MPPKQVRRVQTGIRVEKQLLKVLKGLAEYLDMTLGDLIEGMVLHNFDGKMPFSKPTLEKIQALKDLYELKLSAQDSHKLVEIKD